MAPPHSDGCTIPLFILFALTITAVIITLIWKTFRKQ